MSVDDTTRGFRITRYPAGAEESDPVCVEEPLEIRVNGAPLAVVMRTPGEDKALTCGFLLTEGVIDGPDDLAAIAHCADPNKPNAHNTMMVRLAAGVRLEDSRLERARRSFFATSSCGLCGKATIENVHQQVSPHDEFVVVPPELIAAASEKAQPFQTVFHETGGLHSAALLHLDGSLLYVAEDLGRHNAVDKVLGRALMDDRVPLTEHLLWVSGRTGFEITQKALVAGVRAIVSVGAPSSLAVEMAVESRLTLIGFAKSPVRFNVYAGEVGLPASRLLG